MLKIKLKPYLGILLPIIFIIALVVYPYIIVNLGEEILLETVPFDSTDIFRGDYVELQYKISELDYSHFDQTVNFSDDDAYVNHEMYAVLKQEGPIHVVDYLSKEKPSEGVYLKCNVYMYRQYQIKKKSEEEIEKEPYIIDVDYNINRFYLKEGTGLELEEASSKGELVGKIKVFKGKGILVDIIEKE